MKAIFLDVDGVLNCISTTDRVCSCVGIDDDKCKRLAKIVQAIGAEIVLSSTWRTDWAKDKSDPCYHSGWGRHLDRKLENVDLEIIDKTDVILKSHLARGREIRRYLNSHPEITHWIVLDDETFDDYFSCGIIPHLIQTVFYDDKGGLQDCHVEMAIEMLKKNIE